MPAVGALVRSTTGLLDYETAVGQARAQTGRCASWGWCERVENSCGFCGPLLDEPWLSYLSGRIGADRLRVNGLGGGRGVTARKLRQWRG